MKPDFVDYESPALVPAGVWLWSNFTPQEMACKRTGRVYIERAFMNRLQSLRNALGFPFIVTSGFREGDTGAHGHGCAVDIHVKLGQAFLVVTVAGQMGFTGIGVGQMIGTEHSARFIHLDSFHSRPNAPRPSIWSYDQTNRLAKK